MKFFSRSLKLLQSRGEEWIIFEGVAGLDKRVVDIRHDDDDDDDDVVI